MSQFEPTGTNLTAIVSGSGTATIDLTQNLAPSMNTISISYMVLSAIAVFARLMSRRIKKLRLSVSDYLIIAGLFGAWAETLIAIKQGQLGLGRHSQVVLPSNLGQILLETYVASIIYTIAFVLIKISILLLYCDILPGRDVVIVSYIIGAFVILWGTSVLVVSIFSCSPIRGFWDFTIESTCVRSVMFFVANSIINILGDIAILAIPVYKVIPLQMSIKSKITVLGMFLMGSFVIVSSGLRIYFMLTANPKDLTYSFRNVALWTVIEIQVAVISACLPTVRPLWRFFVAKLPKRTPHVPNTDPAPSFANNSRPKKGREFWFSSEIDVDADLGNRTDSGTSTVHNENIFSYNGKVSSKEQIAVSYREIGAVQSSMDYHSTIS